MNIFLRLPVDQCQKNESKQRTKENLELKKMISSQNEETDEKFFRLEICGYDSYTQKVGLSQEVIESDSRLKTHINV